MQLVNLLYALCKPQYPGGSWVDGLTSAYCQPVSWFSFFRFKVLTCWILSYIAEAVGRIVERFLLRLPFSGCFNGSSAGLLLPARTQPPGFSVAGHFWEAREPGRRLGSAARGCRRPGTAMILFRFPKDLELLSQACHPQ